MQPNFACENAAVTCQVLHASAKDIRQNSRRSTASNRFCREEDDAQMLGMSEGRLMARVALWLLAGGLCDSAARLAHGEELASRQGSATGAGIRGSSHNTNTE